MKSFNNINLILLIIFVSMVSSCFEDIDVNVNLTSHLKTTLTMTKYPFKNESTNGTTAFYGTFILNLKEIFFKPLSEGTLGPIEKSDLTPKYDCILLTCKGNIPDIGQITSNVKIQISIQDNINKELFHPFYTSWNSVTQNEYISFENFWNSVYVVVRDNVGLNELNEAFSSERDEVYIIAQLSFQDYINEDLLNFSYFDVEFDIPFIIDAWVNP